MVAPTPTFPEAFSLARYFLLDRLDEGLGEKVCLRFGDRAYRYADVADRALRFAALLTRVDVRRGERVLVVLPDVPPFVWSLFGVLARGAVLAMGNPHGPKETIDYLVRYTRATCVVTTPEIARHLEAKAAHELPELRAIFVAPDAPTGADPEADTGFGVTGLARDLAASLAAEAPLAVLPDLHRDEPAIWLFTSGSTGEPKANVHTQRDFAFNTEVYAKRTVAYRRDDVTVSVPRLFFGYATGTNLFFPFAVGATTALFSERPTPESLAAALAAYRPTVVTNVPTMLGKLLEHDASERALGRPGLDLSSVRFSLSAGEALPEALLRRWIERFSSDVYDGIGSAEMFHIYASNRPGGVRPGSLGTVVDGYELAILPEEATAAGGPRCAPGEIGVLWVRGDSVSQGYWLDRDRSFKTFHGHWCRTGDLFRMDGDGYLYFAGRADELLKVGGQWLAPLEVEECLMEHERVQLAAVVGVEVDGLTKPKAFVVLRGEDGGSDELAGELQRWVQERLSKHKYPREVEFRRELPVNDRGKVDKKALKSEARS